MGSLGYARANTGGVFWYRDPRYRILSGASPIGRGTYPFEVRRKVPLASGGSIDPYGPYELTRPYDSVAGAYYSYYHSSLRARFVRQGGSVPWQLEADWDEAPHNRQKPITYRAWDEIKDAIDDLRNFEGASAFNWIDNIDPYYVGPLSYRNQIAAALEVWKVKVSREDGVFEGKAWPNHKRGGSDREDSGGTWDQAVTRMLADTPGYPILTTTAVVFEGGKATGPEGTWLAAATRWNMNFINESTSPLDYSALPDDPSDTIMQVVVHNALWPDKRDDWSREWSVGLYKCSGASYDATRTSIETVNKNNIPIMSEDMPNGYPQAWICANVTNYIDLSEDVENPFCLTFVHDNLTSTNGTFNTPPDPGNPSYKNEGVYVDKVRLLQYVDSVEDIGSTA